MKILLLIYVNIKKYIIYKLMILEIIYNFWGLKIYIHIGLTVFLIYEIDMSCYKTWDFEDGACSDDGIHGCEVVLFRRELMTIREVYDYVLW